MATQNPRIPEQPSKARQEKAQDTDRDDADARKSPASAQKDNPGEIRHMSPDEHEKATG